VTTKADPPKGWKICAGCGLPFQFWRKRAVYCSTLCRVTAARKRQRAVAKD
jgi:hypothetical protein